MDPADARSSFQPRVCGDNRSGKPSPLPFDGGGFHPASLCCICACESICGLRSLYGHMPPFAKLITLQKGVHVLKPPKAATDGCICR